METGRGSRDPAEVELAVTVHIEPVCLVPEPDGEYGICGYPGGPCPEHEAAEYEEALP